MISSIGETSEQRKLKWDSATDYEREIYKREMAQWKIDYPFTWEIMFGTKTLAEKVVYAEEIYN